MGNIQANTKKIADKLIYFSLILIPFVASFSSAAVNVFIGFLVVGFLAKRIASKEFHFRKNPIFLPYILGIVVSLISFINSVNIGSSWGGIEKLLKYGFLILIFNEEVRDKRHVKRILIALIFGLFLASFDGFFQLFFGKDLFRGKPYDYVIGLPRLKAAFPHTNIFAAYLGLFLPVCASLVLYYLKAKKKILVGLVTFIAFGCLILTFSRGAVFGFIIAVLFMGILRRDKLILGALALALIIGPFLLPRNIYTWIKTTDSIWEVLLNKERLNIYRTSVEMIKAHPFIGVGVNTYCLNYQKYKIYETSGFTGDARYYAHNVFLHMAGEIGLIGLGIFIWLLVSMFRQWYIFYKTARSELLKIASLGIIAGLLAFLINGLTETTLYYSKVSTLFWYQFGLLLGIIGLSKEKAYEK